MVRHPVERIESHYMHGVHEGWCPSNFSSTLQISEIIDTSLYWRNINAYVIFSF